MKKLTVILLAAALIAMPACKNNQNAEEEKDYSEATAEEINDAELEANMAALIESAKRIKPVPFIKAQEDGRLVLSKKEKMVKPSYLLAPSSANNLATLYQKYRYVGMFTADKNIAAMYDLSIDDYNEQIFKLLTEIDDPALKNFYTLPSIDIESDREAFGVFVDEEYESGRENFFWDGTAAGLVEQLYIVTRDVDKFMPMFTDEVVADITFNFVCVHEGLTKMVDTYPEMASLNEVLAPLYVINAVTVDQFKSQLLDVKADIEAARNYLTK